MSIRIQVKISLISRDVTRRDEAYGSGSGPLPTHKSPVPGHRSGLNRGGYNQVDHVQTVATLIIYFWRGVRSYRKSVLSFCVSVLGRLRDLQYIFAVTSGSPSTSLKVLFVN